MKGLPWRVVEYILRAVNKLLQVSKQGKNKFWQQWYDDDDDDEQQ